MVRMNRRYETSMRSWPSIYTDDLSAPLSNDAWTIKESRQQRIWSTHLDFISLELFQEGNKFVLGLFQIPLVFTPHGYTIKVPERNELFFLQEDKICLQLSKSGQLVIGQISSIAPAHSRQSVSGAFSQLQSAVQNG